MRIKEDAWAQGYRDFDHYAGTRPSFDGCVVEDHQGGAVILLRQMRRRSG